MFMKEKVYMVNGAQIQISRVNNAIKSYNLGEDRSSKVAKTKTHRSDTRNDGEGYSNSLGEGITRWRYRDSSSSFDAGRRTNPIISEESRQVAGDAQPPVRNPMISSSATGKKDGEEHSNYSDSNDSEGGRPSKVVKTKRHSSATGNGGEEHPNSEVDMMGTPKQLKSSSVNNSNIKRK